MYTQFSDFHFSIILHGVCGYYFLDGSESALVKNLVNVLLAFVFRCNKNVWVNIERFQG